MSQLAWHFLPTNGKLQFGRHTQVKPGMLFRRDPDKLIMCHYGLHASYRAIDALQYAPGPIVCRVVVSGKILTGKDKLCASERKVIWMADATDTLHNFACDVAELALLAERTAGREPDARSFEAIMVKRALLLGQASEIELDVACSAASSAAWSADWGAAHSAAYSAAYRAAWSEAWSAAWSAAKSAAWSAAKSVANERLEKMLEKLA